MKKREANDRIKLHEILDNPTLEEHYRDVFSFVKDITDGNVNPHNLTANTIERWNGKFDEVLEQLRLKSSKENND
jgi:hypothetical protein